MRKFTCFTLGLLLACAVTVNAQEQKNDQEGYKFTDIKRLPTTSVKSQDRAGTCWSWSTISFLESEIMRMGKDSLSLSPMYVVWNTYHAKGDKYVRMNGHVNFGQGGASADVTWAIRNYGIVPLSLYSGLNYGEEVHVHGELDAILKGYLDAVVSNPNKKLSTAWLRGYDGILNAYLGEKPEKFTWQGKEYTPMTFATDACGLNMDDYVSLTSFTHHPFYTQFALEVEDNWIEEMSDAEIAKWVKMPKTQQQAELLKKPGKEKEITQELRQQEFDNKLTTDDHGMHVIGKAVDQIGNKYFIVKNSWGDYGKYKGYLYASYPFVAYKTTSVMIHKDALPKDLKKKLGIK